MNNDIEETLKIFIEAEEYNYIYVDLLYKLGFDFDQPHKLLNNRCLLQYIMYTRKNTSACISVFIYKYTSPSVRDYLISENIKNLNTCMETALLFASDDKALDFVIEMIKWAIDRGGMLEELRGLFYNMLGYMISFIKYDDTDYVFKSIYKYYYDDLYTFVSDGLIKYSIPCVQHMLENNIDIRQRFIKDHIPKRYILFEDNEKHTFSVLDAIIYQRLGNVLKYLFMNGIVDLREDYETFTYVKVSGIFKSYVYYSLMEGFEDDDGNDVDSDMVFEPDHIDFNFFMECGYTNDEMKKDLQSLHSLSKLSCVNDILEEYIDTLERED